MTSWAQRDNALQETVTFTNKKKIAYNYSDPGGTLEKLSKLKPLISCNEELYIPLHYTLASEGKSCRPETMTAENQYACHDLSVWNKREKSHLISQNVFLQSILYPSLLHSKSTRQRKRKNIGTSSILAWGKTRVLPTDPPFLHFKRLTKFQVK